MRQLGFFGKLSSQKQSPKEFVSVSRAEHLGPPYLHFGHKPQETFVSLFASDDLLVACYGLIENCKKLWQTLDAPQGSDANLVAAQYKALGPKNFLLSLEGPFVIALWDEETKTLLLARDRVGRHTIFFQEKDQNLTFATSISLFETISTEPLAIDEHSLRAYLLWGYIPPPSTGLQSLFSIAAGHCLSKKSSSPAAISPYWDLRVPPRMPPKRDSPIRIIEQVQDLILRSVQNFSSSTSPNQVILGSGLLNAALLQTFSQHFCLTHVTVGKQAKQEAENARQFAKNIGARSEVLCYHENDSTEFPSPEELLLLTLNTLHTPCADPSLLWWTLAIQFASHQSNTAITNRGEEIIFGLDKRLKSLARLEKLPDFARRAIGHAASIVPAKLLENKRVDFLQKEARFGFLPFAKRVEARLSLFQDDIDWTREPPPKTGLESYLKTPRGAHPVDRLFYATFKSFLPNYLLTPTYAISQAHNILLCDPLCNTSLLEYAAALPKRSKTKEKYPLWQEMFSGNPIPEFQGSKSVPIDRWLRGPLRTLLGDTLSNPHAKLVSLFPVQKIKKLLDEHLSEKQDAGQNLFGLLSLELWLQKH